MNGLYPRTCCRKQLLLLAMEYSSLAPIWRPRASRGKGRDSEDAEWALLAFGWSVWEMTLYFLWLLPATSLVYVKTFNPFGYYCINKLSPHSDLPAFNNWVVRTSTPDMFSVTVGGDQPGHHHASPRSVTVFCASFPSPQLSTR
jgi:hypothetical protein